MTLLIALAIGVGVVALAIAVGFILAGGASLRSWDAEQ